MHFRPKNTSFRATYPLTNIYVAGRGNVTPHSFKTAFLTTKNILHELFLHLQMNKVIILENYSLCIRF